MAQQKPKPGVPKHYQPPNPFKLPPTQNPGSLPKNRKKPPLKSGYNQKKPSEGSVLTKRGKVTPAGRGYYKGHYPLPKKYPRKKTKRIR